MPVPIAIAAAGSRVVSAVKGAARGYRAISGSHGRSVGQRVGTGIGALLVFGVCFAKDTIDFIFGLLMGSGITGILLPIALVAWGGQFIMTTFTWFCVHFYFFAVSGGMPAHKQTVAFIYRLLLSGVFTIIGVIPGVSTFIPEATLGFLVMIMIENAMRGVGTFGKLMSRA